MEASGGVATLTVPRPSEERPDTMVDSRMEHVRKIRERVEREEYLVDAAAVAEAIIERLMLAHVPRDEPREKP